MGGKHKSSKYVQYVLVKIALKVERTMNVLRSQTYMARTGTCTYLGLFSWHACTYLGLFSWACMHVPRYVHIQENSPFSIVNFYNI